MKIPHKLDALLENLEFAKKTKLMILITIGGMLGIGFFMFISLFALHYDHENLYQKRTIPLLALEEIKELYGVNIKNCLENIELENIDYTDALDVISTAQNLSASQWRNYMNSISFEADKLSSFASAWLNFFISPYKKPKPNPYQAVLQKKVEKQFYKIDANIQNIISSYSQNIAKHSVVEATKLEINILNGHIANLVNIHFKEANGEKLRSSEVFQTSLFMLTLLVGIVFFIAILLSSILLNHLKTLHVNLEAKVDEKTKELQLLNNNLEKRVVQEVELNRKKDRIMFQQSRLASLGEMLQNIAHQWRQPLGAISMIIQSFETKMLSGKLTPEVVESKVKDAQVLAEGMSQTLDDFRTFFDPSKSKKIFSLKECIGKAIDLSSYFLENERITLELYMERDLEIFGFNNELCHVFLNLISNAKDILSDKSQPKIIHFYVKSTPKEIQISVIDNGGGVDEAIISKVFDPYFTTKHQSAGTGVGLYMSKQIVQKHLGGDISCKNIRHKLGTSDFFACAMFVITIPKGEENE